MYTALYRKLRPDTFAAIVGQDHIKRTLINQIMMQRLSHAYLFCGTRGTGKTTCARVFARAVNCEAQNGGEACGTCRPCEEIAAGTNLDVIEIDAASNNGVDNIRDLREEVRYPPAGRYKIYIIDEVHMLSTGAFNALLKTLEEPPPHVIFILATTDPQKIPATIHSRLMRFDFHRPSITQMADALGGFMAEENIAVSADVLEYVARISDGSWRDALSLLDRAAALYFDEEISLDKVRAITGSVDDDVFFAMADALFSKDATACLDIIEDLSAKGRDFGQFAEEMLYHLRNMMMTAAKDKSENYQEIIRLIGTFSQLSRSMRHAGGHARLMLEVACIEHITGPMQAAAVEIAPKQTKAKAKAKPTEAPVPEIKKKAVPEDIKAVLLDWRNFVLEFEPMLAPFMAKTRAGFLEDEYLYIVCDDIGTESFVRRQESAIQDKFQAKYGPEFKLNIQAKIHYDGAHRRKYNIEDDFKYADTPIAKLKNAIDFEIEEN